VKSGPFLNACKITLGNRLKLLLSVCIVLLSSAAQAYNQQAMMEAYFGVVMIRGYNENGGMAYGSGVVIADHTVVTNCHVLRATKQPWVSRGEDTYPITSVRADVWHDLCVVSSPTLPFKPVARGNSYALIRGQEISAIGHSNGVPAPITSIGEIQGLYPTPSGNMIRSSAKFLMGASGSGLFDMDGRLVGINTFKTAGHGGSIHFALPVEWLETLEKMPATTEFPVRGKALWEEDEDKKPYYMRAAVPESRQDWPNLEKISMLWTQQETNNADAWFSLGLAEQSLKQLEAAALAFQKAVTLDGQFVEAWFRRGEVAQLLGDDKTVKDVELQLQKIDPLLVSVYQNYLHCEKNCKKQ
jgi:serine protease Do